MVGWEVTCSIALGALDKAEKYMFLKMPSMKYPSSLTTLHQSPEEGQMTWYFLRHIIE